MWLWIVGAALGAEPRQFAFGRLLVEDDTLVVGDAGDAYRATLASHAREAGLPVVGAEDLLFGGDRSAEADLLVAATVSFECEQTGGSKLAVALAPEATAGLLLPRRCEVTARWQVLDVDRDAVVYEVTTRALQSGAEEAHLLARDLLEAAADRLFARQGFRDLLAGAPADGAEPPPTWSGPLEIARCLAPPPALPAALPEALAATAVVRAAGRIGSAVVISPDGFALTAAHVVEGQDTVEMELRSGLSLQATVLRVDTGHDIALLDLAGRGHACLPVATTELQLGSPIFAIGAPAGRDLAFSVSRGITSGYRTLASGWRLLQTDAAVNPGNSGGPLLSETGEVVGIVSFKLSATSLEGLGFAVAGQTALERLAVVPADASGDAAAAVGRRGPGGTPSGARVVDVEDPSVLWASRRDIRVGPVVDGVRPPAWTPRERGALGVLLGLAAVGAGGVATSFAAANGADTLDGWRTAGVVNAASWIFAAGFAGAAFGFGAHASVTPVPAEVAP